MIPRSATNTDLLQRFSTECKQAQRGFNEATSVLLSAQIFNNRSLFCRQFALSVCSGLIFSARYTQTVHNIVLFVVSMEILNNLPTAWSERRCLGVINQSHRALLSFLARKQRLSMPQLMKYLKYIQTCERAYMHKRKGSGQIKQPILRLKFILSRLLYFLYACFFPRSYYFY